MRLNPALQPSPLPSLDPTLAEIVGSKGPVLFVNSNASIEETALLLQQNHFSAVPCFDEELDKFVGFVDVTDILSFAVVIAYSTIEKKEITIKSLREKYSRFTDEELQKFSFSNGTVGELLELPGGERRKMFMFQSNAKLKNAMKILSKQRRILVQHAAKGYFSGFFPEVTTSLMTQTDLLKYISSHTSDSRFLWNSTLNSKLSDLPLSPSFVTVKSNMRVIDGLGSLLESGASALAVVEERTGSLQESLTPHNIPLSQSGLKALMNTPSDFAKLQPNGIPMVTAKVEDTLLPVIKNMLQAAVHEVWIVDKDSKPIALMTMSDIIKIILDNMEKPLDILVQ